MTTPTHPVRPVADISGRDRYARNVAFAWGGYLIDIVAGFLVPRLVSDHLGQASLGIWDFSYSVAAYFALVQLTLGTSVIRYVARYRALGDWEGMNRSASTICRFLRGASWLAFGATLCTVIWILPNFEGQLGVEGLHDARWVVLFFGIKIGFLVRLATYGAVITGCHRWDMHNTITAVTYATTTIGTIAIVLAGGGLCEMAIVNCAAYVCAEYIRSRLAFRVCPELKIENRLASWPIFKEQLHYSAKGLIPRISDLLANQMFAILIAGFLGPASLALFARPRRLIMALRTLAAKAGYILVPSASSLEAKGNRDELQATLCNAPAGIASFALPAIIIMLVFGDWVIRIWMGDHYVVRGLIPVLAVGALPMIVQEPVWSILSGLNIHGRLAFVRLGGAMVSVLLLWWVLSTGSPAPLVGAAWCLTIPRLLVDGIVTPVVACRSLGVPFSKFAWLIYIRPLLCISPFAIGCSMFAVLDSESLVLRTILGLFGILTAMALYWKFLLPNGFRSRVLAFGKVGKHCLT